MTPAQMDDILGRLDDMPLAQRRAMLKHILQIECNEHMVDELNVKYRLSDDALCLT